MYRCRLSHTPAFTKFSGATSGLGVQQKVRTEMSVPIRATTLVLLCPFKHFRNVKYDLTALLGQQQEEKEEEEQVEV